MLLRECKCGTRAYDEEDLQLFVIDNTGRAKYNRRNICKKCARDRQRIKALENTEIKKQARRDRHYNKTYNLTLVEVEEMHKKQDYTCVICGNQHQVLHIDHCHDTGKVRDLLCGKCNIALGQVNEDITILQNLINYIHKHKGIK